jgi:hypothetical protein
MLKLKIGSDYNRVEIIYTEFKTVMSDASGSYVVYIGYDNDGEYLHKSLILVDVLKGMDLLILYNQYEK